MYILCIDNKEVNLFKDNALLKKTNLDNLTNLVLEKNNEVKIYLNNILIKEVTKLNKDDYLIDQTGKYYILKSNFNILYTFIKQNQLKVVSINTFDNLLDNQKNLVISIKNEKNIEFITTIDTYFKTSFKCEEEESNKEVNMFLSNYKGTNYKYYNFTKSEFVFFISTLDSQENIIFKVKKDRYKITYLFFIVAVVLAIGLLKDITYTGYFLQSENLKSSKYISSQKDYSNYYDEYLSYVKNHTNESISEEELLFLYSKAKELRIEILEYNYSENIHKLVFSYETLDEYLDFYDVLYFRYNIIDTEIEDSCTVIFSEAE